MRYYEGKQFILDLIDVLWIDKHSAGSVWDIYIWGADEPFEVNAVEGREIAEALKRYIDGC